MSNVKRTSLPSEIVSWGYIRLGEMFPAEKAQQAMLVAEGCDPKRIYVEPEVGLTERSEIEFGVQPGDKVMVCLIHAIGRGKADIIKTVLAFGKQNVSVQVVGFEPVIYTDQAMAENFAVDAVKVSRRVNAQVTRDTSKTGRKSKWDANEDQHAVIDILWHDLRVPRSVIQRVVTHWGGPELSNANMVRRFGNRTVDEGE